jgi:hypothetical protein
LFVWVILGLLRGKGARPHLSKIYLPKHAYAYRFLYFVISISGNSLQPQLAQYHAYLLINNDRFFGFIHNWYLLSYAPALDIIEDYRDGDVILGMLKDNT